MNMKNRYYMIPSLAALTSCLLFSTACQSEAESAAVAKTPAPAVQKTAECTMKLAAQDSSRKQANAVQKAIVEKKLTPEQAQAMKAFETKINEANRGLIWQKKFDEGEAALKKLLAEKDQQQFLRSKILVFLADSAWRRGDFARVITEVDSLLKQYDSVLTPADKAALYRYKANALDKQKNYCEKAQTLYARLGCAITDKDAEATCNELIRAVWAAGKKNEAVALAKEFIDIFGNETKLARISFYLSYTRNMKDEARCWEGIKIYEDAADNVNKTANETLMVAGTFRGKASTSAPLLAIIQNPECALSLRIKALGEYRNTIEAKSNPQLIIDLANKHLLTVKDIAPADYSALVGNILLDHAARTMRRSDLAEQYCRSLEAYPQITNQYKVPSLIRRSTYMAQRGEYAEAIKLVDQGFTFDKLAVNHYVDLCRQHANLLKWQSKSDEAVKYLRSKITAPSKVLLLREIAAIHKFYHEYDKAYAAYMEAGDIGNAIYVYAGINPDKSRELALAIIQDEKQPEKLRGGLMGLFLGGGKKNAEIRKKYAPLIQYLASYQILPALRNAATVKDEARFLELMDAMMIKNKGKLNEEIARMQLEYYVNTGNVAKLKELKEQIVTDKVPAKFSVPATIAIDCFTTIRQDKAGAFKAFFKNYKLPEGMTQSAKASMLLQLSALALNAKMFTVSEEIHNTYLALYKPQPCKYYNVPFSDEPVLGVHGFLSLKDMPEPQFMDRRYGGNMDFLVTDVSTGDRGGAIAGKQAIEAYKPSEMRMVCDKYGLHMMFTAFDSKAKEIEAGLASAGSFEMYFAPGDNQPYYCPLPDMRNVATGIWNSSYNTANWRQLDQYGKTNFDVKTEKVYTKDGYIVYMFVAWDKFYDKLPEKGDTWDFENVHWSRFGGNSWNGLKTIHGRSTWGKLTFDISDDQMRQIKRNLIIKARSAYLKEKRTSGAYHGSLDRWQSDRYVGDINFYKAKVAPLVKKLDSYLSLVKVDMDDATVDKLFFEAVPGWFEINFKLNDLRREYLEETLSE